MKIIYRTAAIVALLFIASCAKDTADTISDKIDEVAEELESTPLEVNSVTDNVIITGGTKEQGSSPVPNGDISLDISETSKTALLSEGFNISLSSDGSIVGAYLRFKAEDGTAADDYFDINIDENSSDAKSTKKKKSKFKGLTAKVDPISVDVDFNTTIAPGTFCYEICVYDADGNISNPQEVCVTVESWGGSSIVLGEWSLTKEVDTINGETEEILAGEIDCDNEYTFDCDAGGQVSASYYCYISDTFTIEFKEDGTYKVVSKDTEKELNVEDTKSSCEAVFDTYNDDYTSKGNWAYVEAENQLVLVEYEYIEDYRNEIETETYAQGDAPLLFEGEARIENGSLIIAIDEDDENDSFLIYFDKL